MNKQALYLLLLLVGIAVPRSYAHPMGNFSVNRYAKITIAADQVEVLYLVDFAEIPTYQQMRDHGLDAASRDSATLQPYLSEQAQQLQKGLSLESVGRVLALRCVEKRASFSPGAGGLPTLKLGFVYRAALTTTGVASGQELRYVDNNFVGRAGWKEVVVVPGNGAQLLRSSAPAQDRSNELTNYATDLLASPPQQTSAAVEFDIVKTAISASRATISGVRTSQKPAVKKSIATKSPELGKPLASRVAQHGAPVARAAVPAEGEIAWSNLTLRPNQQATPRSRFTELLNTQHSFGFWFLLSSAVIAAGLGSLHALEPGHGKTIVGAYLVGSRGTARHAVLLGLVVTASHVAGVYALGLITLYASRYIVPEQLYPWLGAISGVTVAGLGTLLFVRHVSGQSGEHSHAVGEAHSHYFLRTGVPAEASNTSAETTRDPVSLKQLCLLGITGGIVPCPAALVVLLGAFSLHRIGFGLFLITAFSVGLALVLVSVGLAMVSAKKMIARFAHFEAAQKFLPLVSSSMMVLLGLGIAVSAFGAIPAGLMSKEHLLPLVTVVLLGLFLGVRHSTDPDHVVAVSTIVSRERSMRSSAAIGALWGLGHTLTIFLVGAAIIVFGVVIPPRLGLAMEFTVALMLILLGVLNLTGAVKKITERFSVGRTAAANQGKFLSRRLGETFGKLGVYQTLRPLFVGLVHGLAGSAAVALLVLSTIKSPAWATAYLLVFGLGTTAGMMAMTMTMSLPLVYAGQKYQRASRFLITASGVVSVAFGLLLVYQIGIVDGLFSAAPRWIPS